MTYVVCHIPTYVTFHDVDYSIALDVLGRHHLISLKKGKNKNDEQTLSNIRPESLTEFFHAPTTPRSNVCACA